MSSSSSSRSLVPSLLPSRDRLMLLYHTLRYRLRRLFQDVCYLAYWSVGLEDAAAERKKRISSEVKC